MTEEQRTHYMKFARVAAEGGSEQERRKAAQHLVKLLQADPTPRQTAGRWKSFAAATLGALGVPTTGPTVGRALGSAVGAAVAALSDLDVSVRRREKGAQSILTVRADRDDMDALLGNPLALGRAIARAAGW